MVAPGVMASGFWGNIHDKVTATTTRYVDKLGARVRMYWNQRTIEPMGVAPLANFVMSFVISFFAFTFLGWFIGAFSSQCTVTGGVCSAECSCTTVDWNVPDGTYPEFIGVNYLIAALFAGGFVFFSNILLRPFSGGDIDAYLSGAAWLSNYLSGDQGTYGTILASRVGGSILGTLAAQGLLVGIFGGIVSSTVSRVTVYGAGDRWYLNAIAIAFWCFIRGLAFVWSSAYYDADLENIMVKENKKAAAHTVQAEQLASANFGRYWPNWHNIAMNKATTLGYIDTFLALLLVRYVGITGYPVFAFWNMFFELFKSDQVEGVNATQTRYVSELAMPLVYLAVPLVQLALIWIINAPARALGKGNNPGSQQSWTGYERTRFGSSPDQHPIPQEMVEMTSQMRFRPNATPDTQF